MSPLEPELVRLVRALGPISVARYMALALGHPEHGYYMRRDPLGTAGDFTTAPEISQAFGELIGLAFAQWWLEGGRPASLCLVEPGPGRGTLMADLLRAARSVPGFRECLRPHLVETSPVLRARQQDTLAGQGGRWHARLDEVPADGPLLLVANEFFDALPVHQLERAAVGWVERLVGVDEAGRLGFMRAVTPSPLALRLPESWRDAAFGSIAELSPAREAAAAGIGRRLAAQGGLALVIDYGRVLGAPGGDTLQAVRAHAPWPVLEAPGEADLTAHVDFGAVAAAARAAGARSLGPLPQGTFLEALGIEARIQTLTRRARPEQRAALAAATRRLIDPDGMGGLFKVLALTPADASAPPGFAGPPPC